MMQVARLHHLLLPHAILLAFGSAQTITITAESAGPTEEPQWASDAAFRSAILNSTNFYREEHNATGLTWNDTLSDFAAAYLDGNSDSDFEHSGGPYGENLAMGYPNATASVEAWGNERDGFNFRNPDFSDGTGHFTQLVWKNTTAVGCGRKSCEDSGWFLVCEYWPRGNVIGAFGDMVGDNLASGAAAGVAGGPSGIWLLVLFWVGTLGMGRAVHEYESWL